MNGNDPQKFSSFTNTINYPRSTGFIDFDMQTKRPAFPTNKAHEHRFQNLEHFPPTLSATRRVQQTSFREQVKRDDLLQRGI